MKNSDIFKTNSARKIKIILLISNAISYILILDKIFYYEIFCKIGILYLNKAFLFWDMLYYYLINLLFN